MGIIVSLIVYSTIMVILACLLGKTVNELSEYVGEKTGGLIAATSGNLPELFMCLWAIQFGMIEMAQAGIIGTILANILLGLGIAIFCGGIKYTHQKFNKIIARTNISMLVMALSTMVLLWTIDSYAILEEGLKVNISLIVATLMLAIYVLGLIFSMITHKNYFTSTEGGDEVSVDVLESHDKNEIRKRIIKRLILLGIIALGLNLVSEQLIEVCTAIVEQTSISQQFLGVIIIPMLGACGEIAASVMSALDNKINLSIETATGSGLQIILFVAPILVFFSATTATPITLFFAPYHIIITAIAVAMAYMVFQDGKTYWFEGGILVMMYLIIAIGYYYMF